MNQLTLEWSEAGQHRKQVITEGEPSKSPGSVRLGRDPNRCDIILHDPTVSGLHVEIFYSPKRRRFCLRNLRESNPPIVDQHRLTTDVVVLNEGSKIYLGQQGLRVVEISAGGVPPTVLVPPSPSSSNPLVSPTQKPTSDPSASGTPDSTDEHSPPAYGLECPKCGKVSSYEHLRVGCPWCGASLAAAASVLMIPEQR